MNNLIKTLLGAGILALNLYAIDAPSTLSVAAPSNAKSVYGSEDTFSFSWSSVTGATKYYYSCDKNATSEPFFGDVSTVNLSATCDPSSSGSWYVHVQAFDGSVPSVNVKTAGPYTVDVDPPAVPSYSTATLSNGAVEVTLTGSSGNTIRYEVVKSDTTEYATVTTSSNLYSDTTKIVVIGSAKISAVQIDNAANMSSALNQLVSVTGFAPKIVLGTSSTTNLDNAKIPTSSTNLITTVNKVESFVISGDGIKKYKYKFNDGSWSNEIDISNPISNALNSNVISGLPESSDNKLYLQLNSGYFWNTIDTNPKATFTVDNTAPQNLVIKYDGNDTVKTVNPANKTNSTTIMTLSAQASTYSELKYKVATTCPTSYADYTDTFTSTGFSLGTGLVDKQEVKVCMAARDSVGNWAKASKTYTIDKKAPSIYLPATKTYSKAFTTTIASDDDDNNATDDGVTIKYTITPESSCNVGAKTYDGLENTYSTSVAINLEADNCLYAAGKDKVGNKSSVSGVFFDFNSSVVSLSVDLLDNQKFATVSTYGATPTTDINVSGAGTDYAKFGYEFDENGTETNSSGTTELISLNVFDNDDGDHNVTIRAYKADGSLVSSATEVRLFYVDNTPPSAYTSNDYNDSNYTTTTYTLYLNNVDQDKVWWSEDNTTFIQAVVDDANSSKVKIELSKTTTVYTYKEDEVGNKSAVYSATLLRDIPVQSFDLTVGWNLTVLPTATTLNDAVTSLTSPIVWDYNGTDWKNNVDSDSYDPIASTDVNKGYWVYLTTSGTVEFAGADQSDSLTVASGWELHGTTVDITTSGFSDSNITWEYESGIWKYFSADGDVNESLHNLGYNEIDTIEAYSGFWTYK